LPPAWVRISLTPELYYLHLANLVRFLTRAGSNGPPPQQQTSTIWSFLNLDVVEVRLMADGWMLFLEITRCFFFCKSPQTKACCI
jgi:hypothetical protein